MVQQLNRAELWVEHGATAAACSQRPLWHKPAVLMLMCLVRGQGCSNSSRMQPLALTGSCIC